MSSIDEQRLRKSLSTNPFNHNDHIIEEFISKISEVPIYGIPQIHILFLTYILSMQKPDLRSIKHNNNKGIILKWFNKFFQTDEGKDILSKISVTKPEIVRNLCIEMTYYIETLYPNQSQGHKNEEKIVKVDWGEIFDEDVDEEVMNIDEYDNDDEI